MFLLPFFLRNPLPSKIKEYEIRPVVLFLENHGRGFCQLDEKESTEDWLDENGFVVEEQWQEGDFLYVRIDPTKTNMHSFYSYEQLTFEKRVGTEECWRTFYIMRDSAWFSFIEEEFRSALQLLADRYYVPSNTGLRLSHVS